MSNRDVFVWAFLIRFQTSALNLLHVWGYMSGCRHFIMSKNISEVLYYYVSQYKWHGLEMFCYFFHLKTVTFFLNLMMTIKIIYLSCIYKKECNIDLLFIVTKYIVPSSGPILNYMYSKKKYTMIYIKFNSNSVLNGITQHIIDINY